MKTIFIQSKKIVLPFIIICATSFLGTLMGCGKGDEDIPKEDNVEITIEDTSLTIPENPSNGTALLTMTASVSGNGPLVFSITSQNPADAMAINATTGQISVLDATKFDYEVNPELTANVIATSGSISKSAEVRITLTDVAENMPPEIGNLVFEAPENIDDAVVIGTITATDAENDPLQFALVDPTANSGLFELTTSGDLSLTTGNTLDYEAETQYTIQVSVSDGVNEAQATITVNVTNIIEVTVEIVAGSATNANGAADGTGTDARFFLPADLVLNTDGILYVAERQNHLIRAIDGNNNVTTFAGGASSQSVDGTGTAAGFNQPLGIDADASGNLYVADQTSNVIRKITAGAEVTTIAGENGEDGYIDGPVADARFKTPRGLAIANDGTIYVVDAGNHAIRKISNGMVTTLAGNGSSGFADGQGTAASFNTPHSIDVDNSGNVYVVDQGNLRIRKVTPDGVVTTIAGNGSSGLVNGSGLDAEFGTNVRGICVDDNGNVYVSDTSNQVIRMLIYNGSGYNVITLAGVAGNPGYMDGDGDEAQFFGPAGITYAGNNTLYVTEEGGNRMRKLIVE